MMCNIAPMAEFKPKSTKMCQFSNIICFLYFQFFSWTVMTACPDSTNPKKTFLIQTVSGVMIHCGTMSQHKKIYNIFFLTLMVPDLCLNINSIVFCIAFFLNFINFYTKGSVQPSMLLILQLSYNLCAAYVQQKHYWKLLHFGNNLFLISRWTVHY